MALITVEEARSYIPALRGTADDGFLTTLIDVAGETIASRLGWPSTTAGSAPSIESASRVFYVDGPSYYDPRTIRIPVRPVISITSIYDDPLHAFGSDTLVDSSEYDLLGTAGTVSVRGDASHSWSRADRSIKVTCVAGFSTIPARIKHQCGLLVRHWYANRSAAQVPGVGTGAVPQRYLIPDALWTDLAHWRLHESGVG